MGDGRPLFSVVIPAYRAADTVGEAIESALSQTRRADEVIVVDDASPDNQWAVIEQYRAFITAIRLPKNGGEAAAKNAGAAACSSRYVVTLDADDAWLPERLAAMEERCRAADMPIVTTDAWMESGSRAPRRYYEVVRWAGSSQRDAILSYNFIFSHAAVPRDLWLQSGGMDEIRRDAGADWPLWTKLILSGARAELVDQPLVKYRVVEGSLSDSSLCLARTQEVAMRAALACASASDSEVQRAKESLRDALAWAGSIETLGAIYAGEARRWSALRLITRRGVERRDRAKAALSILSPAAARRRMRTDPRLATRP